MVEEGIPRWLEGERPRLDDGRVLAAPRVDGRAHAARGLARQAGRADGRDPAPDRARASRRHRLREARRANGLARLRRPPGRRRHAVRGDLRRVRRGPERARPLRALARARRSRSQRSRSASSTASRGSTSSTPRTRRADVDMNVVMTGDGRLVEVQATAEGEPFTRELMDELIDLAARRHRRRSRKRRRRVVCLSSARSTWRSASSWRRRSAARSGSSGRCASARRGSAPTCSSRSARRSSSSSPRTRGRDWTFSQRSRHHVRPDADRGADRHRHRLPRRGRDHPPGALRPRPDDRRDALARRRDRHGERRRLLGGGGARDRRRAPDALAAPDRRAQALVRLRPEAEQRLIVDLGGGQGAAPVLAALEELGGFVSQFQLSEARGGRELVATVQFPSRSRPRRSRASSPSSSTSPA